MTANTVVNLIIKERTKQRATVVRVGGDGKRRKGGRIAKSNHHLNIM